MIRAMCFEKCYWCIKSVLAYVGGPVPAPPVFMSISDSATHITILRIWNYKYMLIHEHETAMLEQPWLVTYSIYVFFLKSKKYGLSCDVHCCILFRAHAHHSHVIHSAYVGIQTYIRSLQPYRPYQVWCNTIPVSIQTKSSSGFILNYTVTNLRL